MRGTLEHQRHLGDTTRQSFSGAQEEGHPRPAPGVHLEGDRGERLGRGLGGEAALVEQARHLLVALPARGVLAARRGQVQRLKRPGRREHLDLLGLQLVRTEADGFFHRRQRQQLDEVVLNDVARSTDTVVIAGPAAQADVLGHRDLDMIDVVGVPDRLVELVGEPQRQDVLHRLLAEIVVDTEHRLLGKDAVDHRVELAGAGQVVPERLLDHDPAPPVLLLAGQARLVQLFAHDGERLGRDGQVEGVISARAAFGVELVQRLGEPLEGRVVVERALHEAETLGQPVPHLLTKRGARMLLDRLVDHLAEVLVGPVPACETHQGERRRQ